MSYLREKIETLSHDAELIFKKAKDEGRELNSEELAQWDKAKTEILACRKTIDAERDKAGLAYSAMVDIEPKQSKAELEVRQTPTREAFNAYLRSGGVANRDQFVITTGSGSGALLPQEVATPVIVRRMWNAYVAAAQATGQPIIGGAGTQTISLPVMDDSSNAGQETEEDDDSDTAADPTVSQIALGATLFDSKTLWYSNTQLGALPYDLASYMLPILDKRVELAQNSAFHTKALTYQAAGNTITTSATNGITYAEFVQWFHKLGAQFRADGAFIVSDGLLQVLESLTDDQSRPLINMMDSIQSPAVAKLKGCPVVIDTDMDSPAAGAVSGLFISGGSLHIRQCDNRRIAIYKDYPAAPDQTGYREFVNADFGMSAGYAFLKHAAS
ncbi:MAG: hypothetical protein BIFFINMI_03576 [Phycisphaerae bacterium]|nr:hypothetical protein [Phycisphaerae bacterium]